MTGTARDTATVSVLETGATGSCVVEVLLAADTRVTEPWPPAHRFSCR